MTEVEFLGHSTLTLVTRVGADDPGGGGGPLTLSIRSGGSPNARPGQVVNVTYCGGPTVAWVPAE